jgi:type I restriction enzyme S subunit
MTVAEGQAWRSFVLGEFLRVKHGYAFKGEHFSDSGPYIVLTPGNFYDEGGFKHKENEKYYTGDFPSDFLLKRGDLLVVMTEQKVGLLGSPAIVPEADVYLHNQRLGLIVDLDADLAHRKFLYYLFNFRGVREQIQATANGAKVRHTSPSRIYEVEVRLPSLEAQCMIASILSAYDDLIANNLRRIKILEEMAQALFREWFVKFRFPGHEKVRMVESSLGEIPEGWEVVSLASVAAVNERSIGKGNSPARIKYVDIASVSPGRIDKAEDMAFTVAPSRARRIVKHGDTMWSAVRPNRRSFALILNPPPDLVVSTGFAVLSPISMPYTFLHQAVTTDAFVGYLTNHATGAAYPAVNAGDFENAELLIPTKPLLERFHELVEPMEVAKNNYLSRIPLLQETRDLLLPKLISGDLDVSDLDIPTPEDAA